jgi:hypothetical protein
MHPYTMYCKLKGRFFTRDFPQRLHDDALLHQEHQAHLLRRQRPNYPGKDKGQDSSLCTLL